MVQPLIFLYPVGKTTANHLGHKKSAFRRFFLQIVVMLLIFCSFQLFYSVGASLQISPPAHLSSL